VDHCRSAQDHGILYSASLSRIIFLADSLLSARWKAIFGLCVPALHSVSSDVVGERMIGCPGSCLFSVAALNASVPKLTGMDAHDPTVTFYRAKYVQRACSTPMLSRVFPTAHELGSRFGLQLASLACCHILHQDDPFIFFLL
jgi:hypothetical protein